MLFMDLNGQWRMKRTDQSDWMGALVPGSVYSDLLAAGAIEDPFYRDNENKALELSNYDYEYEKTFDITTEMLDQDKIELLCEGLDTLAEVSINGNHLADTDNMHRLYEFDVKPFLSEGSNTIHILFRSPVKYVKSKQKALPLVNVPEAIEGISHLRKAHYMFGWDWGPKLPDMGIWRSISLQSYNQGRIKDVFVGQVHEDRKVKLEIKVSLEKWCDEPFIIITSVKSPSGYVIEKENAVITEADNISVTAEVPIEDPQLWWPNNFGAQPLYEVSVSLYDGKTLLEGKTLLDGRSLRIGLRTMEVRREKDQWGESFEFVINGTAIFMMGADYIPEDNILARCSGERTEKLIQSCVDANFNAIRVWGGGYYPEDYFYDLCDEYGLVVWQDLMFACGVYNFDKAFKETVTHEVADNMKRLRHHASLGLWCGNNEQEEGWVGWGWTEKCSPKLKTDYIKQFEVLFPEIAGEFSPDSFYWPASPSSGGSFDKPNDENRGDMHYWGVWHGKEPFTAYRKYHPRFMSEFGIQSFPCLKTVETFTLPEDRNIFSYVMEAHQKNGTGNEKILHYVAESYKYPKDFDSLLYVSQLIQAEGLRYGVEHWRRNRGRCMGAIYWQLNDCWPVASWSSVDYFGRYKALHYYARRFFAPVLVSACEEGTKVSLHVSNETMERISGTLEWALLNTRSGIISSCRKQVTVNALSSGVIEELDFEKELPSNESKRTTYLKFVFTADSGAASDGTVLFVKPKHFAFTDPELRLEVSETDESFIIKISSRAFAKYIELDLAGNDAVFSDNYFDLPAGETRMIELKKPSMAKKLTLHELRQQLIVRSLFDTYK